MFILIALLVIFFVAVLIHALARINVLSIQRNPDPYPLAQIEKEPEGREFFIQREDGTRIRALVSEGTGPTAVFAHGYGLSVLEWTVIWSKLRATGYRLIAFDARGHGKSTIGSDGVGSTQMAADLKAVLEHFDVRDGVLIGHSMGGFLSIRFLLNHPEVAAARLKHGILLSTFAGDIYRGAPQTRLQIPLITSGILTRLTRTQTYGWAFGSSLEGDRPAPSSVELLRRSFAATNHIPVLPILRAFAGENYYDRLGEINLPCTVVYGLNDKTTPAYHSETMHARIRGSQIVRIPRAGHLTNWEAPEKVTEVILAVAQNKPMPALSPALGEESARAMPVPLAQANL